MKHKILITCLISSLSIFFSCQNGNSFFSQKRVLRSEIKKSGGLMYYDGKPFTGIGFEMWDENIVKIEIQFKDGKVSGTAKKYYKDGTLEEVVELLDGKKNGSRIEYREDGKEQLVRNYLNDDLHGKYFEYYKNGNIEMECTYKDGRREGLLKEYYENGKVKKKCNYVDGSVVNECINYENNQQ
jgi:antitoxin component YwqK of YwqJK toxin-antitoxin module